MFVTAYRFVTDKSRNRTALAATVDHCIQVTTTPHPAMRVVVHPSWKQVLKLSHRDMRFLRRHGTISAPLRGREAKIHRSPFPHDLSEVYTANGADADGFARSGWNFTESEAKKPTMSEGASFCRGLKLG